MNVVAQLIHDFDNCRLDKNGEALGKCEIVLNLEDHLIEPRVIQFFLRIVGDPTEYDLARIEALKILRLFESQSREQHDAIGQVIAEVLTNEEDVLVKQWDAIAARSYMDVPQVFDAVTARLLDPDEDTDVRHNCLAAIERAAKTEHALALLRQLMTDPEMGSAIQRVLREWESRH